MWAEILFAVFSVIVLWAVLAATSQSKRINKMVRTLDLMADKAVSSSRNKNLEQEESTVLPIETFGLLRGISPRLPDFYEKIVTGKCESEVVLPLIGKRSTDPFSYASWLAVSWVCVQEAFALEESTGTSGAYPRRISGLAREYQDMIVEKWISPDGQVQNHYPPEFLFNGVKHAVEQGLLEVVNGPTEDYLVLTDAGIALFPQHKPHEMPGGKTLNLSNWRDASSHAIKQTEIAAVWGEVGGVPDYMWFVIRKIHRLNELQIAQIKAQCFKNREPSFGDIELHGSTIVPGETALRVRNADTLALEVEIDGVKYPMYQAGHGNGPYVRFCPDPPKRY